MMMAKKQAEFKKVIGLCSFEAKNMRGELTEVIGNSDKEYWRVKKRVNETSWNWLSGEGSEGLRKVSREEVLKYKEAFTDQDWNGVMKTWEIVEDRARTTEKQELDPLGEQLRFSEERLKKTNELANLCDEFLENFDSIFNDTDHIEDAARSFIKKYNNMDDVAKSYKKHSLLDDCTLLKELKELLHGDDSTVKSSEGG